MDNGAHFYRCDFQVHTPRDPNWSGNRPDSPAARREFADRLVAACRQKGIAAIAITDHHDFAYFPVIKEAAQAEVDTAGNPLPADQQLVVFPGLELTLGVPCQALLILDADFPAERLSVVLEALAMPTADPEARTIPPVQRIDHIQNLDQLYSDLDRRPWLQGAYIVLPNVTDGGHGTLMRQGMQAKYKDMPCVGGYIDGRLDEKVGDGNKQIFAGTNSAWGSKGIALFQTSDSRTDTFDVLGRHSTWVKWARPTAEALRQACLAQESRVMHEPPAIPSSHLTRLSVSNSRFMGPVELELNPQYNAIIGGRGTGKSSCLEYIRWALCDQPASGSSDDEISDQAARRVRLIAATLMPFGGHVDVHFILNGIRHVVRRHTRVDTLLLKVGDAEFRDAREEDIRSLLPIQAYSQKQLSSVSVRLEEVTRFVTSPIRSQLEQIDAQATTVAGRIRQNFALMQRQRDLTAAISRDELAANSLLQQAGSLRDSLGAVSDEDRACLTEKPQQDMADEFADGLDRRLDQAVSEVARFKSSIEKLRVDLARLPVDGPTSVDTLHRLNAAVISTFDGLGSVAQQAVDLIETARADGSEYAVSLQAWRTAHTTYEAQYADAKERSAAHQSKVEELSEIEQRGRRLRETVTQRRRELADLGDPTAEHVSLRGEWLMLQEQRSQLLRKQCEALTELSGGLIRATLQRGAGLKSIGERIRVAITGSGVRGAKIDAFVEALVRQDDPIATWESALAELEPSDGLRLATLTALGFTANDVEKMVERLSPESWLGLALTAIDDHPMFEYQTKDGEYIAFSDASAGQQATALLRVLLNQGGPPLIIDQPEEDLDSQVIQQIIEQIWATKTRRQIIFTSHNPNLVVNGDAELVICCDYRAAGDHSGGKIKLTGAIDIPDLRNEITTVMEGGEKAFKLRKAKYGF